MRLPRSSLTYTESTAHDIKPRTFHGSVAAGFTLPKIAHVALDAGRPTSVFLLHAKLPLQRLPQLPLSDQLHFQLRPLHLVLLLLGPGVLYGNPQQTLLGDTQAHINRSHTDQEPGEASVSFKRLAETTPSFTSPSVNTLTKAKLVFFTFNQHFNFLLQ